jgi:hypothetical protein
MYEIILYYINNGYPPMNKGIMDIKLVKDHDTNKWLIIPDDNLIGMINGDAYEVFGYYDYIFSQNTTVFSVGKEVISGTGGITVEKVDRIAEPAFDKDLVLIHVKIRNTSDRVIAYYSFDFKIQTSSNNIVEQLYNQTTLTSGELEPGQYVTGIITYEIKRNDKDLNLLLINEPVVLARFIL